jgi:hypothetical protein
MPKYTAILVGLALLALPGAGRAHCDGLDGPVVSSARAALDGGDVKLVLKWVKEGRHEREVRAAFQKAVEARKRSPAGREASDRRFFETVVRVHRAGEGAKFAGLKPAGYDFGPAIRAADEAVASGSGEHVEHLLVEAIAAGLRQRLAAVRARTTAPDDVAGGREWVAAYVDYVHYVEGLSTAAKGAAHHEQGHAAAGHASEHGPAAHAKAQAPAPAATGGHAHAQPHAH